MSEWRGNPQTWEHIENKGSSEAILACQTWEHTEKKLVMKDYENRELW